MLTSEDHRQLAERCIRLAKTCSKPTVAEQLMTLAANYLEQAERAIRLRQPATAVRQQIGAQPSLVPMLLWKLGYQLLEFRLRPSSDGAGTNVSLRADRERPFGDVVAVRGIDNDKEIVVSGREVDLFDFNSHFLGELPRRLCPLGERP